MKLAIRGGRPLRSKPFPAYVTTGNEERRAVDRVLRSGILSRFLGCWHDNFYGGDEVRALEREWAAYFKVKHAIAVNSATSGLNIAVGAIGAGPGDEIVTTPYTMSATIASILVFNAIPVFADIEEDFYCVSADSFADKITSRTRAVIAVNLLGQPYDAENINRTARKRGLYVIEDCAQAPGALYKGRYAGTVSDIGVFSLNYHKHIHCGEGGVAVTNNNKLAERMRLIRNHAEVVVSERGLKDLANMIGFNFRMTELEASVVRCQLKKLKKLVDKRVSNVRYLEKELSGIPAIKAPEVREGCTHVYYEHAMKFSSEVAGIGRDAFIAAVKAELPLTKLRESEGVLLSTGYYKPAYLQPLFRQRVLYGNKGCPFKCAYYPKKISYRKGMCKVTERMHFKELFTHELMHPYMSKRDLDDVVGAFYKVWENRKELRAR